MLSLDEGLKAVTFARDVIEQYVKNNSIPSTDLKEIFTEKQGAFERFIHIPNITYEAV